MDLAEDIESQQSRTDASKKFTIEFLIIGLESQG